jgi:hypothetical protein
MPDDGTSPTSAQAPPAAAEVITSRVSEPASMPGFSPTTPHRHGRHRRHLMSLREWVTLVLIGVLAALLVVAAVIGIVAH